jgi:colanic acid biosynthesis glycosyl transferase WcaI
MADVHLVLQKGDASDLVMPSKLTTILSVGGLALVTANANTSLGEVMNQHQMGVVIEPENEDTLKDAILRCCSEDYTQERVNARRFAEINLNKDNILKELSRQF